MKFYRPLFINLTNCLNLVLNENKIAPHVLESTFKSNKKWGSKDRKAFAEAFYEIVKWQLLLKKIIGPKLSSHWESLAAYYLASRGYIFEDFLGVDDKVKEYILESIKLSKTEPFQIDKIQNLKLNIYEMYSFTKEFDDVARVEIENLDRYYHQSQQHAPLFVRANLNINNIEALSARLSAEGHETQFDDDSLPFGLELKEKSNLFRTQAFKDGAFEVQDGGSQQISPFLQVKPGDFVIDACAGGGGKSLHLSNLMENKGRILAMDIHGWKLDELKKRARRNKCHNIEVRTIEGTKTIKRLKDKADKLLLDVPCTGSGVYRRNPDSKYKWTLQGFEEIVNLQKSILSSYSSMVKPGGHMVYSTCSVMVSENQKQIKNFMIVNPEWVLEEEKFIEVGENRFDGYYMARLQRSC